MYKKYLQDQRGIAMLLELVLVAAVLSIVGLAVYQSNHRKTASVETTPPSPTSAQGLAASAAAVAVQESASDSSISASAESSVNELSDADADVTNLGGSFNESNF